MEILEGRTSRFLPDDTLTVGVELTVFGEQCSREIQPDDVTDSQANSSITDSTDSSVSSRDLPNGSLGYFLFIY